MLYTTEEFASTSQISHDEPPRRKAIKFLFRHAGIAILGTVVAQAAIFQDLPVQPKF